MNITLLSGASLLSLSGLLFFKSQLQLLNDQLQLFERTNILTPSAAYEFALSQKGENEVRFQVFLQGMVSSDHPFVSKVAKIPLILSQYYIDNIYSNKRLWCISIFILRFYRYPTEVMNSTEKTQYFEKNIAPVFQVSDIEGANPKKCIVTRNQYVDASNAFELVGHREHLRSLNLLDRLFVLFGLVFKFILKLKLNSKGFRGFKIGVQEIEYGVQLNQIILVFGELIVDIKNGTMKMDVPLNILKDKSALLKKQIRAIRTKSIHLLLITMLFSFFSTWLVRKIYQKYLEYIDRKKEEQLDQLRDVKQVLIDGMECIVCFQNPRSIILKPCKHLSMCRQCFLKLPKKVCPICKALIKDSIEIYIS